MKSILKKSGDGNKSMKKYPTCKQVLNDSELGETAIKFLTVGVFMAKLLEYIHVDIYTRL